MGYTIHEESIEECSDGAMVNTFLGIDTKLNTYFKMTPKIEEIESQLTSEYKSIIGEKETNKLIKNIREETTQSQIITSQVSNALDAVKIDDADFLNKEMKTMMSSSRRVLETLEKEIKIGASPRVYEVYGSLVSSITGQFKELRALNESMAKLALEKKKHTLEETKEDHKMLLSSVDAIDMFMRAKDASGMGAIDADFDVESE